MSAVRGFTPLEIARPAGPSGAQARARFLTGFTLAEVLVIVGLLVIVIVLGLGIFLSNNRFYENQTGKIALVNVLREAADRIAEYGREAAAFESSYAYGSTIYNTGAQTVIFRLPARNASDDIIAGIYDYAIITASSTVPNRLELLVDADPGSARPERNLLLTDSLTSVVFTYDNVDVLQAGTVTFEITATAGGRYPATEKIYGQTTLRN